MYNICILYLCFVTRYAVRRTRIKKRKRRRDGGPPLHFFRNAWDGPRKIECWAPDAHKAASIYECKSSNNNERPF